MYGVFGGYTRWAVVFLIIFVLFFLLVPGYLGGGCATGPAVGVAHYGAPMMGGYNMMSTTTMGTYAYESPSSL